MAVWKYDENFYCIYDMYKIADFINIWLMHYIMNYIHFKKLQIKFDIKLIGLKKNYLNNIKLDLDQYLYIEPNSFKPDFFRKRI